MVSYSEGYEPNPQKERHMGKSGGGHGQVSRSAPQWSHRMDLLTPASNCGSICELLSTDGSSVDSVPRDHIEAGQVGPFYLESTKAPDYSKEAAFSITWVVS